MTDRILLVVPEAPAQQAVAGTAQRTISAKGLRLGTLDNSKSNADHLLAILVAGLQAQLPIDSVVSLRKPTPSLPAEADVLERLAKEADIVVSAMAD